MAQLASEIKAHRDQILDALAAAHDYYVDSVAAWRIVRRFVAKGHPVSVRNRLTGTVRAGNELAAKGQYYVTEYVATATFQQFVSLFEDFIFGLMGLWLEAFPQQLGDQKLSFSIVVEATDLDSVKREVVSRRLNELKYEQLREWFKSLDKMVDLGCPTQDEIAQLSEIKASRDVLVHNHGIVNATYERKAGTFSRFNLGQKLEISSDYHREAWELIRKVVSDVCLAAIAKAH